MEYSEAEKEKDRKRGNDLSLVVGGGLFLIFSIVGFENNLDNPDCSGFYRFCIVFTKEQAPYFWTFYALFSIMLMGAGFYNLLKPLFIRK